MGKIFTEGTAGWLAHAANGLLYIKQWSDVAPGAHAPNPEVPGGQSLLDLVDAIIE